ncbi:MAG: hypothetical protein Q8Q09_15565 [Deltaproteobacteria bacterium]|nr:hypothetical protein [Deltaproteobacteria bacterium]
MSKRELSIVQKSVFALGALVAVVGCKRVTPITAAPAAVLADDVVIAHTDAPAADVDAGPLAREACDSACALAGAAAVRSALPLFETDAARAATLLRASRAPMALAWAAYLAHHAGNEREAEALLNAIGEDASTMVSPPESVRIAGHRALWIVRARTEEFEDDAARYVLRDAIPCVIFQWDRDAALDAFAPQHGSSRDTFMSEFKDRCSGAALRRALGADEPAVSRAVGSIRAAIFRQWPVPQDGTMFLSFSIAAGQKIGDAILGAPINVVSRGPQSAQRTRRATQFQREIAPHLAPFARGLCAVDRTLTPPQCDERARAAALSAYESWVSSLSETRGDAQP